MPSNETIVLDPGERVNYPLDTGEVFENVLIDQSADGAFYQINARGSTDWTIRNVGWEGIGDEGPFESRFHIEGEGDGLIENVFMEGWGTPLGGIYAPGSHAGHIVQRHSYIAGFGNNAVYASSPAKDDGEGGTWEFENCYHRDCTVSQFRIGAAGSTVRNCVAIVNDPSGRRDSYPWSDSKAGRGVWIRHCPNIIIENTSVYISPDDVDPSFPFSVVHLGSRSICDRAEAVINDCDVNADAPQPYIEHGQRGSTGSVVNGLDHAPTMDVLQGGGVPTSASMAANGERVVPEVPEIPGGGGQPPDDGNGDPPDNGDAPEPRSARVFAGAIGGGVAAHLIRNRLGL